MDQLFKRKDFKDMDRMGFKIQVEEFTLNEGRTFNLLTLKKKKELREKWIQMYLKVCERCEIIK